MTDADAIFGIMASLGRKQYSIQTLCVLTSSLDITENSLRTNLHRMQKKGTLYSRKENSTVYYSFAERGNKISRNVSAGFFTPDWSGWDNMWWGVVYSVPENNKPLRHKIRSKLELYRFTTLHPGLWIRPKHSTVNIFDDLKDIKENGYCKVIRFQADPAFCIEEIQALWQVDKVNTEMAQQLSVIKKEIESVKTISPQSAFRKKMITGEASVNTLFKDPLLPDIYLPKDWKANALRKAFADFDARMTKKAEPFINLAFEKV